jgi:hypothetical protein
VHYTKFIAHVLTVGILIIGNAGCAPHVQFEDPSRLSQIQKGITTKSQISSLFGSPSKPSHSDDGSDTWSYTQYVTKTY